MTREGGTKSNFSPFLMFLRATRPRSPTSTISIPIFCGGRPESDSHRWSSEALSRDSISQPHGTSKDSAVAAGVAEIEQRGFWREGREFWREEGLWWCWGKRGTKECMESEKESLATAIVGSLTSLAAKLGKEPYLHFMGNSK